MNKLLTLSAAAIACGAACMASARTMTMTENRTGGEASSFDFTFDDVGAGTTNSLYMAFGNADGGTAGFSGWATVRHVAQVPGDTTSLTGVLPPAGWDADVTQLRFFLMGADDVPGAQRVAFIQATGRQYVRTDYTPKGSARMEGEYALDDPTINQFVFFSRPADAGKRDRFLFGTFGAASSASRSWRLEYGNMDQFKVTDAKDIDTGRHTFKVDYRGLVIDGSQKVSTGLSSPASFTAATKIWLFAAHYNGSDENPTFNAGSKLKLYSFKAWADGSDDSTLTLDLLPCTTNGVACFYNRADGTFLGNNGSDAFVAGDTIAGSTGAPETASDLVSVSAARKTLGLWTFDGVSGGNVVGDRATTATFSNHVARAGTMRLDLVWPESTAADTPLPTYTDDVQYAYLFDGLDCTSLVQVCGSSIQIKHKNWDSATSAGNASWNKPHAYLKLEDAGAIIKNRDWTLEVVARLDDRFTGSGLCPMLVLGTNTGNRACFTWRTNNGSSLANIYATAASSTNLTHTFSYPRYDDRIFLPDQIAVRPCDGNWHHIAWKWSESARTLSFYVDYGLVVSANYWNSNGVNLELDDHAAFSLFPSSSTCTHLPTIQAVRLTRGDLSVRDFLCTSRFPSLQETVGHWRYEGTPGETNCLFAPETQMPNRTDLRLWKQWQDHALAYVAPWKPYVRLGSEYFENLSGVCGSTNETDVSADNGARARRCYMSCMQQNPWWTLPGANGSFTYEVFLRLDKKTIRAGDEWDYKAVVFAEKDGPGGMKDSASSDQWQALNWGLCQDTAAADAPGARMALVSWEAPDGDEVGNGRRRSDIVFHIAENDWHHIAVTYDAPARTLKIYVDHHLAKDIYGNDISVTMGEGYHLTRGASMVSPGENNALYWYGGISGAVDEFRVTRRALAVDEFLRASEGSPTVLSFR